MELAGNWGSSTKFSVPKFRLRTIDWRTPGYTCFYSSCSGKSCASSGRLWLGTSCAAGSWTYSNFLAIFQTKIKENLRSTLMSFCLRGGWAVHKRLWTSCRTIFIVFSCLSAICRCSWLLQNGDRISVELFRLSVFEDFMKDELLSCPPEATILLRLKWLVGYKTPSFSTTYSSEPGGLQCREAAQHNCTLSHTFIEFFPAYTGPIALSAPRLRKCLSWELPLQVGSLSGD